MACEETGKGLVLLEPTAETEAETYPLALRASDVSGTRIGFLDNGKERADEILAVLEELLAQRFKFDAIVRRRKRDHSKGAPPALIDELAERCRLVVTAVGG